MKKFILGILLTAVAAPSAPAIANQGQNGSNSLRNDTNHNHRARDERRDKIRKSNNGRHRGQQKRAAWQEYNRYDYNRYDPHYGNYRADRYYRDGSYYQDRRLNNQDRIYRGSNNRYYCRRNDGTTGLIIGAVGGGLLGRAIAPNGSKTLGTILGGTGGAVIGRSIGRNGVRCN
jgi:Ni/Co efflux regulator RcnB